MWQTGWTVINLVSSALYTSIGFDNRSIVFLCFSVCIQCNYTEQNANWTKTVFRATCQELASGKYCLGFGGEWHAAICVLAMWYASGLRLADSMLLYMHVGSTVQITIPVWLRQASGMSLRQASGMSLNYLWVVMGSYLVASNLGFSFQILSHSSPRPKTNPSADRFQYRVRFSAHYTASDTRGRWGLGMRLVSQLWSKISCKTKGKVWVWG